jgi:hypothetical protein
MQREKGKRFERDIAARLRALWPNTLIRRASQAERADNPDVFVEAGPELLMRLWLELQDARTPTPIAKLEQAERDAWGWQDLRPGVSPRLPVVIWHRFAECTTWATMRLATLDAIRGELHAARESVVTLDVLELLQLLVERTRGADSRAA